MTTGYAVTTIWTNFYRLAPFTAVLSSILCIVAYTGAMSGFIESMKKSKFAKQNMNGSFPPKKNDDPYVSSLKLKLTILGVVLYFLPVVGIAFLVHSLCLVQGGSVATLIDNLGGLPIITWVSLFLLLFIGVDEHFIYTLGQFLRPGNSYANSFSVGVDILWVIIAVSSCVITLFSFKYLTMILYDFVVQFFEKTWLKQFPYGEKNKIQP